MAQLSLAPQHDINQIQETFSKIIKQLAGQLWQSKLQETLQDPQLKQHLTPQECSGIATYEQLFDLILTKELVSPYDLTLLKQILNNHSSGHSLLWAVYEAGFGQLGLHRANAVSNSCGGDTSQKLEESLLTDSLHSTCSNLSSTSTGRRTSVSDKPPSFFRKPATGTKEFKQLLRNINAQIDSREDLGALKLLCSEVLSHRQLDSVTTALELFSALKRQRCMTTKKPEFLYRILQDCGRWDLSDLVDGYVYVCLKKGSANRVPVSEDEEENRERNAPKKLGDRRGSYRFVRSLKLLGDELGRDDLATMKMLAVSWIPDSKLEKVNNVYEFFILLLERGKLSQDDISFLEHLLYDKLHVIRPLRELGFGRKTKSLPIGICLATHSSSPMAEYTLFSNDQDQLMMNFRQLLKTIASRLTSENIREIKYLCPDEMGSLSSVKSGLELLSLLEKWREIEPTNVTFLLDTLEEVGRKDLCTIVVLYQNSSKIHRKSIQNLAQGTSSPTLVEESTIKINGPTDTVQSQSPPKDSYDGTSDIATEHAQSLAAEVKGLQEHLENVQAAMQKEKGSEKERAELTTKLLECSTKYNRELEKNASLQEDLLAHQKLITKLTEEAQQQKAAISTVEHNMEVQELQMKAREAEFQLVETKTEMELLEKDLQIDELTKKLDSQELLLKTLAKSCGIRLSS